MSNKNCPVCGSENLWVDLEPEPHARCGNCAATGPFSPDSVAAVKRFCEYRLFPAEERAHWVWPSCDRD